MLAEIAKIKLSSADVPLFRILRDNGFTMGIDFSYACLSSVNHYPYIHPKQLLEILSENHVHKVLGVPTHLAEASMSTFWNKFQRLYPQHEIFTEYFDLSRVIPYYLHGDGGRGFKKEAIEIVSMLPVLGAGSTQRPVSLGSKRQLEDVELQGINLKGNSGATRFLFTVLSSLLSKKNPTVFDELMELWGKHLRSLLADGFQAKGSTWRVLILGFTGDSPFVKKVAKLQRSFNNVRKTASSRNPQKGCCWLCHAGYENGDEQYPFEDLGLCAPLWIQTAGLNNPLPWSQGGPLIKYMLLDAADTPAAFFRPDFFHVWHAGVGKDFTASALIYAMKKLYGLGGVKRDLKALNEALKVFLRAQKTRLHCGFLTEDLLGYTGTREYPEGKWSKNMDTAVLMKFVVHLCESFAPQVQDDYILEKILETATAIGNVIRAFFDNGYFMPDEVCRDVIGNGHEFLFGYAKLTRMCLDNNLCLFKLRPKIHYLNHIFLRIYQEWEKNGIAINACAEATFMSEDFVGKTAKISRRVNPRSVALKTLQRYVLWMRSCLDKDHLLQLDLHDPVG